MGFRRGSRTSRKKQESEMFIHPVPISETTERPSQEELDRIRAAYQKAYGGPEKPDHFYELKAREEAKRRAAEGRARRMANLTESRRKQRRIQDQERHRKNAAERHPVVKPIGNPRVSMLVEQPRIHSIDSKGRMEFEAERSNEPIPLDPLTKIQIRAIGSSIFAKRRVKTEAKD